MSRDGRHRCDSRARHCSRGRRGRARKFRGGSVVASARVVVARRRPRRILTTGRTALFQVKSILTRYSSQNTKNRHAAETSMKKPIRCTCYLTQRYKMLETEVKFCKRVDISSSHLFLEKLQLRSVWKCEYSLQLARREPPRWRSFHFFVI